MVPLNTVWKGSQVGNTDLEGTGQKPWVPWVLSGNMPNVFTVFYCNISDKNYMCLFYMLYCKFYYILLIFLCEHVLTMLCCVVLMAKGIDFTLQVS